MSISYTVEVTCIIEAPKNIYIAKTIKNSQWKFQEIKKEKDLICLYINILSIFCDSSVSHFQLLL